VSTSFVTDVLVPLVRGTDLERAGARDALAELLRGEVPDAIVASFLTAITMKGETIDEMTGFVDAMMDASIKVSVRDDALDIVGTGGDQLHTVNISTMASFAVAGAGVAVAKHGNRSATSSVGSADVLEALGVRLSVTPEVVTRCVNEAGFGFFFAPAFHPALGNLGPIRRALGFRTIFNVLGPLANPAQVRRTLIGVAQEHLLNPMAQVMMARGVERAVLVRGDDGLDELSVGAPSSIITVEGSSMRHERVDAGEELGFHHEVASIRGGDAQDNMAVVRSFLDATPGPVFNVACANAGLALVAAGRASSIAEGFALASASVTSGAAANVLDQLVAVSNS